jgi:hypothetical protein
MKMICNFLNKPGFSDVFSAPHMDKGEGVVLVLEPSNYVVHIFLLTDI